ncbi:FkbM family methyltransferase [Synechococcus sp. ATX 2A4]|nr:FkbM family methyltransferase [Synechococcus sp. ATX 2A4]
MVVERSKTDPSVAIFTWQGKTIRYCTPNAAVLWRVDTLLSKEPCTIEWLCQIQSNETFFDIGANVGMYSLFAAICQDATVYAFEPESQNYALLNKNIHENQVSGRVHAYCLACSDQEGFQPLYLSSFETGGSCHSVGEEVGFDLQPRRASFTQGAYAITIDQAIASGGLPTPNHIKIDVDGFEHKVLRGASKTLNDSSLRSLIIEINPMLPEHQEVVFALSVLGFEVNEKQIQKATRKDGPFKGVGEWIFTRREDNTHISQLIKRKQTPSLLCRQTDRGKLVSEHVVKQICLTPIKSEHFPISIVDNVFPEEYYQQILDNFPSADQLLSLPATGRAAGGTYEYRQVAVFNEEGFSRFNQPQLDFWSELGSWLYHPDFVAAIMQYFDSYVTPRIEDIVSKEKGQVELSSDALIVSDQSNYAIGPHTDAPHRLLSLLFYLPHDDSMRHLGTSLYTPKQKGMTCHGLRHHDQADFERVATIDYIPNRLVLFPKTDSSFHGVEAIRDSNPKRQLLISNVRVARGDGES